MSLIFSAADMLPKIRPFEYQEESMKGETIAAISTAVSSSGIGIVRISGDQAFEIADRVYRSPKGKKKLSEQQSHTVHYGYICDGDEVLDEVLVVLMRAPRSFTAEDTVEIDCHGGVYAIQRVLEAVIKNGAAPAEPGEFTKRAFLNGRIDLSQAEAVMDLIDSKNEMARKNSMTQLKGGLSDKIKQLREEIIYQIAFIESALDDPEHYSLDGFPEKLLEEDKKWITIAKEMLDSYDNGRIIAEGIRTCIVGKPNAGKSSFLNALLGEERAIVTDIAGTTRDTLEESVTIDGITLNIVDTAGIRDTEDKVESIGVERAKKEIESADLILFLMDTSVQISEEDIEILQRIRDKKKIILLNKSDKATEESGFEQSALKEYISEETPVISISAKYGDGIDNFIMELKNMMFHGRIDVNQEVYITNARHKDALAKTYESLECVERSIEAGMPEDFFTIDLMNAYEKLGLIIGESVEEDLVNEIFSKFCTGK